MAKLRLAAVLALTLVVHIVMANHVGLYFPGWFQTTKPSAAFYIRPDTIDLTGVTHVYYAFAWINEGPDFSLRDEFGNLEVVMGLRRRYPGLRALISIGGGGFDPSIWSAAAGSAAARAKFVAGVAEWVARVDADGVDLDWEFPGKSDRANLVLLATELRAALDSLGPRDAGGGAAGPQRRLLTAAVPVYAGDMNGLDLAGLAAQLDYFNIMSYELADPCYGDGVTGLHTGWTQVAAGLAAYGSVPPGKLVLGLGFYGHGFTLVDAQQWRYPAPVLVTDSACHHQDTPSYKQLLAELASQGGSVFVEEAEKAAYYVRGRRWVGFDTPETLWMKQQAAAQRGMAGVMIWDVTLDSADQQLLRAVTAGGPPPPRPCGSGWGGNGTCVGVSAGQCCGEMGYCGLGDAACGAGCRGGPCAGVGQSPPPPPRGPLCGGGKINSGQCANSKECCSQYGYCAIGIACFFGICGTTIDHCGNGCQGGACLTMPPPPPGDSGVMCGDGHINNGRCMFSKECCSQYGYCGTTDEHCGEGCKGGACKQAAGR
ncbi:hypothetical protein HXX76_002165 [Chlamydomonas incerta]|uniref:Chitinase n=1 Tax=Chlamydomonas incerta TaxID=51695 RepID=A0A835WAJ6_CHLIN|nr:hypothetical protein HXX76_002165 [Chlamydomonas incerta]|eukprot:KAG2443822.1 hypothetical protein HXX76_002165 [Chlamydomonas incerta]